MTPSDLGFRLPSLSAGDQTASLVGVGGKGWRVVEVGIVPALSGPQRLVIVVASATPRLGSEFRLWSFELLLPPPLPTPFRSEHDGDKDDDPQSIIAGLVEDDSNAMGRWSTSRSLYLSRRTLA